ncbi:hypothetical protein SH668x_002363 [Planctomicrobium sp. SH668]|uniref:hypothetical protein n=1 Tax=Planctomicrobium sp. SH668 TaxID=3448126 RepID=UPI003F5B9EF2
MNFRVLPEAQGDAIEAAIWYDDRQASLGTEFLAVAHQAFQLIQSGSQSLSKLETYHGPHDVRRLLLKRFPYAVVVLVRPEEVVVVAVAHTRRRPLYWLDRLG